MENVTKKIAFLAKKSNIDFYEFDKYWSDNHGHIVANSPRYNLYRTKYVQNHIHSQIDFGDSFDYCGIAEFWLPTLESNEDIFSTTDIYQNRIKVDEQNFIDMDSTISMTATEIKFIDGDGDTKIILISELTHDRDQEDISETNIELYFSRIMKSSMMQDKLQGFTCDVVHKGSFLLPGARTTNPLRMACMETFRFADVATACLAFADLVHTVDLEEVRLYAGLGRCQSLLAKELVFFENGAPTRLANPNA